MLRCISPLYSPPTVCTCFPLILFRILLQLIDRNASLFYSKKYTIGTPKYFAIVSNLSAFGTYTPFFQLDNVAVEIPVSFDTWYGVLFVLSNNNWNFSYTITPP